MLTSTEIPRKKKSSCLIILKRVKENKMTKYVKNKTLSYNNKSKNNDMLSTVKTHLKVYYCFPKRVRAHENITIAKFKLTRCNSIEIFINVTKQ